MRLILQSASLLRSHGLIRSSFLKPSTTLSLLRFNSNITKPSPSNITTPNPPTQPLPESIRKTIPGETDQTNSILSRLPTFPLRSKNTLLPRPGVPTAATASLRTMVEILQKKRAPELIYEAESHQTYFVICGALAVVFAIYGLTFVDWGFSAVWTLYQDDQDLVKFAGRGMMCLAITVVAASVVWLAISFPTRLVRRMWIVPGKTKDEKFVRFTTHPLLPNRATPVYTVPLNNLTRGFRAKVYTRNGIYGTLDRGAFFFLLKEMDKKFGYWVVDRQGWFWGDGRVFDVLFGKETIEEASKGLTYDQKLKEASEKLKEEREKLKKEHGPLWQVKTTKKLFSQDLKKVARIVADASKSKKLPKD